MMRAPAVPLVLSAHPCFGAASPSRCRGGIGIIGVPSAPTTTARRCAEQHRLDRRDGVVLSAAPIEKTRAIAWCVRIFVVIRLIQPAPQVPKLNRFAPC